MAQEIEISGSVLDSALSEPIPGAIIKYNGQKKKTTDDGGKFVFMGEREGILEIDAYGFKLFTIKVTRKTVFPLVVQVVEAPNQLETVVISVGKYEQKLEEVTVSMDVLKPAMLE